MLFETDALPLVHRFSAGVPRLINTICDNCLFEAFIRHQESVSNKIVFSVAGDLGLPELPVDKVQEPAVKEDLDEIENLLDRLEQKL